MRMGFQKAYTFVIKKIIFSIFLWASLPNYASPTPTAESCFVSSSTSPDRSWKYGLFPEDIPIILFLCYVTGRQFRNARIFPNITDSLIRLCGDIIVGFTVNFLTMICHEAGHAIFQRLLFNSWPESVSLGSSYPDDCALLPLFGEKIIIRGFNPFAGFTKYSRGEIPPNDIKKIPVLAAGSLCGIIGYYLMKMCYLTLFAPHKNFQRGVIDIMLIPFQTTILLELINLLLDYDSPGTDAYGIVTILTQQKN